LTLFLSALSNWVSWIGVGKLAVAATALHRILY